MGITPKTSAAALTGALTVVLIWVVGLFHVTVPPEIASAITTILSSLAAYLAPRSDPTPDQVTQILNTAAIQQPK